MNLFLKYLFNFFLTGIQQDKRDSERSPQRITGVLW